MSHVETVDHLVAEYKALTAPEQAEFLTKTTAVEMAVKYKALNITDQTEFKTKTGLK